MGEWETVSTVTECDPPHRFAWAVGDPGHPSATWRFTLKPDGAGTLLEQWYQMGPARSGLNIAIDAMPDKEAKIVFVRLREHETGMKHNLAESLKIGPNGPGRCAPPPPSKRRAGKDAVEFAVEAERLGLDVCWVAEAWGADAPSPLGYLAARTERMLLGSGVIQIGTRSPVTIAQTAMTLAHLSGGRFLLGLGVSGPQVMEGLHGVPFGHPLGRMRETVEIVRRVFTGEKVTYAGRHYGLPLPGSEADAGQPAAGVGAGVPGHAVAEDAGADRRDRRRLARHQLHPRAGRRLPRPTWTRAWPGRAGPGPTWTSARAPRSAWSPRPTWPAPSPAARTSSPSPSAAWARPPPTSTTTPTAARAGPRSPPRSATRWQAGDRDGAAALVTDEMVLATTLIGTEDMVRARLRAWRDAGVDTVRLYPAGDTPAARLDTLARGIDLVRALG